MGERERRWRLVLGEASGLPPEPKDAALDRTLTALYEPRAGSRKGGLGGSAPSVARWLGDVRTYFPASVVQIMQRDAIERLGLKQLLLEPEFLESVEPDVHLVSTLVSLSHVLPEKTRETARQVVRKLVDELMKRVANTTRSTVLGSLRRGMRSRRPRHQDIDWNRTIRANLKHYQAEYRTVIPERLLGHARTRHTMADITLCVDQSGSMAASVVYSSIFAAVLASMPALQTRLVVFDTAVVDLTEQLSDPVDVLFGTQLGGGTDIARALAYCLPFLRRPQQSVFVLISDLYEGGVREKMLALMAQMVQAGVQCIVLLALSDEGAPVYDHENAEALASLGIPAFACTPDQFPDLMAAALARQDLHLWAAGQGIVTTRG
jgi:Mg-chelatase subunit ChlD